MPCFAQEYQPKLHTSNHCKPLSSLIRETYAHCHGSCLRIPSSGWSSDDDESLDDEFDTKQVILNEMRSRQMKKRSITSIDSPTLSGTLLWSFTPLDPRSVLDTSNPKTSIVEEQEEVEGAGNRDEESEAFFSVKSFFSRSTSRAATVESDMEPPLLRSPVMWNGFRHCEGWPFGLCQRAAVMPLPPLPSTPSDSWKWRKRTGIVVKSDQPPVLADGEQYTEKDNNK